MMEINQLNYLALIDTRRTSEVQGGLYTNVQVNTYASQTSSAASANAAAVGQIVRTSTNTQADFYQSPFSGRSSAYAQGYASASKGQDTQTSEVTERKTYWW